MRVRVHIPTVLRELTGGAASVDVDLAGATATVGAVFDAVGITHAALERRIRDEHGLQRVHVNVFVGPDSIRDLRGMASPIAAGAEISIIPAISGG